MLIRYLNEWADIGGLGSLCAGSWFPTALTSSKFSWFGREEVSGQQPNATFKLNLLGSFKNVHRDNETKFIYYLLSRVNTGLHDKLSGRCMKPVPSLISVLLAIRTQGLVYFKFNSMKAGSTQGNASTIPDKIYC